MRFSSFTTVTALFVASVSAPPLFAQPDTIATSGPSQENLPDIQLAACHHWIDARSVQVVTSERMPASVRPNQIVVSCNSCTDLTSDWTHLLRVLSRERRATVIILSQSPPEHESAFLQGARLRVLVGIVDQRASSSAVALSVRCAPNRAQPLEAKAVNAQFAKEVRNALRDCSHDEVSDYNDIGDGVIDFRQAEWDLYSRTGEVPINPQRYQDILAYRIADAKRLSLPFDPDRPWELISPSECIAQAFVRCSEPGAANVRDEMQQLYERGETALTELIDRYAESLDDNSAAGLFSRAAAIEALHFALVDLYSEHKLSDPSRRELVGYLRETILEIVPAEIDTRLRINLAAFVAALAMDDKEREENAAFYLRMAELDNTLWGGHEFREMAQRAARADSPTPHP